MPLLFAILGLTAALLHSGPAWAGCGLESCPVVEPGVAQGKSVLRIPLRTELTSYDLHGARGRYLRTSAGLELWGEDHIVLSTVVPALILEPEEGARDVGLGNPIGNVQVMASPLPWLSAAGGVLIEVPLGDKGLVDDHWVAFNHLQLRVDLGGPTVLLRGGYLKTFGESEGAMAGHDGHAHDHSAASSEASPVDPHADEELRLQGGLGFPAGDWTSTVLIDSALEVDDGGFGTRYHSLGTRLQNRLNERHTVEALILVPVSEARRYDWRASMGLTLKR